jgi:UDP-glucose 4-epimerase
MECVVDRNMRILVTGATGFVGGHLVPALLSCGYEVVALCRKHIASMDGVHWVECDLAQTVDITSLPAVDTVIHLAQSTVRIPEGSSVMHAVNTVSTLALLEHARRCAAKRFILASTGNIYGFSDHPFLEVDPPRPASFYALTKCHAEALVESYKPWLDTVILRFFSPYGPGQNARLISDLIERVKTGKPVILKEGGKPNLTPIFIEDLVNVMLLLLRKHGHHKLNIAGDEHVSVRQIAQSSADLLGVDPSFEESEERSTGSLMGENASMKALLGSPPLTSLREGLGKTLPI